MGIKRDCDFHAWRIILSQYRFDNADWLRVLGRIFTDSNQDNIAWSGSMPNITVDQDIAGQSFVIGYYEFDTAFTMEASYYTLVGAFEHCN